MGWQRHLLDGGELMGTSGMKTFRSKGALLAGVVLVLAVAGGWWVLRGAHAPANARLGPGLYELSYAFDMKIARGAEHEPVTVETKVTGQLELAEAADGWLAARVKDVLNHPRGLAELAADPAIRHVFDQALHWTYWGVLAVALLAFAATWLVPVAARPAVNQTGGAVAEAASH